MWDTSGGESGKGEVAVLQTDFLEEADLESGLTHKGERPGCSTRGAVRAVVLGEAEHCPRGWQAQRARTFARLTSC